MKIKRGRVVSISYLIRDNSGEIVEYNDAPITYPHRGEHDVFPQIEEALEGKKPGDQVTVTIKAADAFGTHDPSLTFTDDIENSPPEMRYIGAEMDAESPSREVLHFRVTEIKDGKITIDANHVLAGKDLTFEVTVAKVKKPNWQDLV